MAITSPAGNYPPPPPPPDEPPAPPPPYVPPPPPPNLYIQPPVPNTQGGTLAPQTGEVVRDQYSGYGRYSSGLVAKSFKLDSARDADSAKHEPIPGHVLQVLVAQGGTIPDDARIQIGGSGFFPLIEGFAYETETAFDGYDVYWPTGQVGVTVWILVAHGRKVRNLP